MPSVRTPVGINDEIMRDAEKPGSERAVTAPLKLTKPLRSFQECAGNEVLGILDSTNSVIDVCVNPRKVERI